MGFNSLDDFTITDHIAVIKKTKSEYDKQYEQRKIPIQQQYEDLLRTDKAQADSLSRAFIDSEQMRYRAYLERVKSLIQQSFSFEINENAIPDSFPDEHVAKEMYR